MNKYTAQLVGLDRTFGVIPDGCNGFTMHSVAQAPTRREIQLIRDRVNSAAKRERNRGMSKAQVVALALRSPEERKADLIKRKPVNSFNTLIAPAVVLGSSAQCKAKAGI